ncbi:MAG: HAMP domain-containing histidine kinase [Ardenticatenaceae bacterium]|nr:HAMP domain-containing histidine kinase [Anaerolineales bacterium]MCB8922136.1 HAMP domain-containing histidine kinase [Ardenticatenaceae bacterium]MCB8991116.1 HAMP domain-containing histidine kinase [Ardenticatenaceae bacterium]MCB9005272.1 HAMP domain-containing histidine kinase [Ardenticatenaceae bacterium]
MAQSLTQWLHNQTDALCRAILYRAPNMLPDVEDVADFLHLVADNAHSAHEVQLLAIQNWALTNVGHDAPFANDWVTLLRVLKQEVVKALKEQHPPEETLNRWMQLDELFSYALIEVTQLASDIHRASMLEHMADLRHQMEHVERTKASFIGVAAHELRTPLTILEGYANILRAETAPDSQLRLYVEGLGNGTRRMNEIIADIIDVSLIDMHQVELKYQEFYLEKVILMAADKLDKHFGQRRVDLVIMPLPVEERVYGDPEHLLKAFSKVLLNGLKYTPDGGRVTVTGVLTRQEEATGTIAGYIDVQIADTGIGIDRENFDLIFSKFTSVTDVSLHSSGKTKFKGGGPGLGLPIAKGIVEAHGGRIWVESPGCDEETCPGSIFHLEIPLLMEMPEGWS